MAPVPKPRRERSKHFFKEWREYRGFTQEQAIGKLGWSQSKISRLEAGVTPYDQDDLEAAAEAYRCDPTDLIRVDPTKEGEVEVVDLMRLLDDKNRAMAVRMLKALTGTDS
ncbi:helix-turn-helix domain-containing protein [Sinorhizobium meliloti]|uniref:helix-turn-helix domain-containing protein n=1 Tax=Rhizobium meliloti TaxID=382 RepID=UPI000B49DD61|nr:helix-turn-helix transcriptional regulator [Sinorhizobium meliloti]ASP84138.1 XRE family transcriptional regulator [Sinorhizobium meliloti]MDW9447170.1 helix-turn-helix domain-containing protein [Sinorhizobium meliloti]MDW9660059.1 helix-turn-helix domain-containing protein [Sinorhizobium meliloti]MDX0049628.1 helix-turn-helix domain-containing protein [Sinorhizobium meliloti]MDX0250264.1 helix-turn-helix domain-containing protein [Sinorhizobium meliloti]